MTRRELMFGGIVLAQPASCAEASPPWGDWITKAFEKMGSDLSNIEGKTKAYTSVTQWRQSSVASVALAGGLACSVPFSAYAALPVEFMYFMGEVYNSVLGVGFLMQKNATRDDFANVLGVWADEVKLDDRTLNGVFQTAGKVAAVVKESASEVAIETAVEKIVNKESAHQVARVVPGIVLPHSLNEAGPKILSKTFAKKLGTKVAGKLGAKIAAKAGVKIGSKYAGKLVTGGVIGLSALVCGGLNGWILSTMLDSSELYYRRLAEVRSQISNTRTVKPR